MEGLTVHDHPDYAHAQIVGWRTYFRKIGEEETRKFLSEHESEMGTPLPWYKKGLLILGKIIVGESNKVLAAREIIDEFEQKRLKPESTAEAELKLRTSVTGRTP
jgi:hypothetical protein